MNYGAIFYPSANGFTSAGTYAENRKESRHVYCQITGKECGVFDKDLGLTGVGDCRSCTIPLVASLIKLEESISDRGD